MLTISDRFDRRSFLKVGSLALGGLSLLNLLQAKAQAAETRRPLVKDRSVIFLFLQGGPSQYETFDPKMDAPPEIRSITGAIQTRIPGVTFGATFPRLAALADKVSIVRSYVPGGDGNHSLRPINCAETFGANLSSIHARIAGRNHPDNGMPTNVMLAPRAVDPTTRGVADNRLVATGGLGTAYAPLDPSAGSTLMRDMQLRLPMTRLDDRRALLSQLDQVHWSLAEGRLIEGMDRIREQAITTVLGGVADAFDLAQEDPRLVAAYDTAPLIRPVMLEESSRRRWEHSRDFVDNAKSLGKLMLLARRLCERGAGFVTVSTGFVWDMHADGVKNAPLREGFEYMGTPLDRVLSTFINDIEARGLSDKILLVVCGEMGRTPRINRAGGRDHWPSIASLLLCGGGLNMGQVIGRSTSNGGNAASAPLTIENLIATILHQTFDMGQVRLAPGMPREIAQTMAGWEPIAGLV